MSSSRRRAPRRRALLALLALLCSPPAATAAERTVVHLNHEEAGVSGFDPGAAVEAALPMLLDRLVPAEARARAGEAIRPDAALLRRISPGAEETVVEFHLERITRRLEEAGIDFLAIPPRFHAVVRMRNAMGYEMEQSAELLEAHLREVAPRWGVELAADAPKLVLAWQWLDAQRVELVARGNALREEFTEARRLTGEDPLPAMRAWATRALIAARDRYADAAPARREGPAGDADTNEGVLTLERRADLSTLVAFEGALSGEEGVAALVPVAYGREFQRYRLRLRGGDAWMRGWFSARGMRLERTEAGWLAR